ncbi:aspartate ammonia-lyase [Amnibacterium sp. CER49]|uniref:aspartate ammonia-lyase n=1 Tax=Amnibacterium sp. CER49 TaxID=3039161 RepID=UPI002446816A|nr:aspartate ammonia-lyase [Amnibacterium sp. CER49]MDH2444920.1 aspartate ammonia-lyase [Amnibacterium sp. CER49]
MTDVVPTALSRLETDSLGAVEIPADAYWGAHTARALENFAISGRPISIHPRLVDALAIVKQAAARANRDLGAIEPHKAEMIEQACLALRAGRYHDQFVVDVIQGGAGTSTNMNANEVIANVALELAGHELGDYGVLNPIDDVNRSQSTNDVYPTAAKISIAMALEDFLVEHEALRESFARKGEEFHDILKVGRTQLQDAVPMTLGQEFHGFATTLGEDVERIRDVLPLLREINLGATAIGTGITADPRYAGTVRQHLSDLLGEEYVTAGDLVEATSDTGVFMQMSGVLKRAAIKLSKICNDLRLLSSGPQAGLGEITLPPRQAGSSIMPGKVNPVIPEVVNQVAFAVVGHDVSVTMAAEGGQLQLNAFEPLILHSILTNVSWLRAACRTLRVHCVDGIQANVDRLDSMVRTSVGVVTALTPYIGYAAASALAKTALLTGRSVADLVVEAGLMDRERVEFLTSPARLSGVESGPLPVVGPEGAAKAIVTPSEADSI